MSPIGPKSIAEIIRTTKTGPLGGRFFLCLPPQSNLIVRFLGSLADDIAGNVGGFLESFIPQVSISLCHTWIFMG